MKRLVRKESMTTIFKSSARLRDFRAPKFRHVHPAGCGQFGSFGIPLVFELPILAIAILKLDKDKKSKS